MSKRRFLEIFSGILLCGWYLMEPPAIDILTFTKTPIAQWSQVGSGDTAKECENQGEKNVEFNQREEHSPRLSPGAKKLATTETVRSMDALCIASDDPRLKQ